MADAEGGATSTSSSKAAKAQDLMWSARTDIILLRKLMELMPTAEETREAAAPPPAPPPVRRGRPPRAPHSLLALAAGSLHVSPTGKSRAVVYYHVWHPPWHAAHAGTSGLGAALLLLSRPVSSARAALALALALAHLQLVCRLRGAVRAR